MKIPDKQTDTFPVSIRVQGSSHGELQLHQGGNEDLLREFSHDHGHWVKRERQMCSERTSDPITLISVMHITWSRRVRRGRRVEQGVQKGSGERGRPINTHRIFLFILIMTCQWNLEGRREKKALVVARFLSFDLEMP